MVEKRRLLNISAVIFWGGVMIAFAIYKHLNGYSTIDIMEQIYQFTVSSWYAPVIYIIIYALKPLTFFPATLLTILGGGLFGLTWGILYTLIAKNLSANIGYFLGKYIGRGIVSKKNLEFLSKYDHIVHKKGEMVVILMRLTYMPFDLVSYGSGILGMKWSRYSIASFIGFFPGIIAFVAFGSAVNLEEFLLHQETVPLGEIVDMKQMFIAVIVLIFSIVLAKIIQHHKLTISNGWMKNGESG